MIGTGTLPWRRCSTAPIRRYGWIASISVTIRSAPGFASISARVLRICSSTCPLSIRAARRVSLAASRSGFAASPLSQKAAQWMGLEVVADHLGQRQDLRRPAVDPKLLLPDLEPALDPQHLGGRKDEVVDGVTAGVAEAGTVPQAKLQLLEAIVQRWHRGIPPWSGSARRFAADPPSTEGCSARRGRPCRAAEPRLPWRARTAANPVTPGCCCR